MNEKCNIMIVGATSAIARATALVFASEGANFFLIARSPERLAAVAGDLKARGATRVESATIDLTDAGGHRAVIEDAYARYGSFDAALVAHGVLPEQAECERDPAAAAASFGVNATSVIAFLLALAPKFEAQKRGRIAVIGSVAGDRGRRSNYVYGAAKAAVDTFLQGYRIRMAGFGVAVVTIKPGFVDTPMTERVRKNPLFADAKTVGRIIHRAMSRRGPSVVYAPRFWAIIMVVIRALPVPLFRKLPI